MTTKAALKRGREPSATSGGSRSLETLPEVALAAIASYRKQSEVSDFINFILAALERNSEWLNSVVGRQPNFKCVLMTGAGPNRFQIQEVIYPSNNEDIKLEVELNESEDYDKIALTAVLKLSTTDIEYLLKYIKTKMYENPLLKDDLLKGKAMGVNFAVLRPINDKQYRVMERICIGNAFRYAEPCKKRRREDKSLAETIIRKTKRIA